MKKSALGRGLGALISDVDTLNYNTRVSPDNNNNPTLISDIALDMIDTNPFQPRTTFDEVALSELSESIKVLGVIQPITVRSVAEGRYQIISGERRFRAATLAGLTHIPAYIRKADDQGMLEMAIVENIQREDLDAIEVALSFQRLIEECKLTQEKMADRVGKNRTTITNYLRLLKLPAEIQLAIRAGKISMGHAKALASLGSTKKQIKLCNSIIENGLSVRDIENKTRKINEGPSPKKVEDEPKELDESSYRLLEFLGKYFNNNISLNKDDKSGKGSITIRFESDQEILRFVEAIEKTNL